MKIFVNVQAYSKILLHASKYPHKAINGVVLAEDCKQNDVLRIVDAVPLFHQCLGLAPMLEIALTQIDVYCQRKNLVIAGYYQANEHVNSNSPDNIAFKIAEKINDLCSQSLLIMVNNLKMDIECKNTALDIYCSNEGKWKKKDNWELIGGDISLSMTSQLIKCKTYQSLTDFDNHLDDISLDWLNTTINDVLKLTPS